MFLSQKGSLGRNPMINRVGQRLLQLFEGASAAYSLRDLASNIASVVRVRRASDNSEKDFSAADVSSGAMTQWVNAQIVPPLDVRELVDGERTGALIPAAAAYSLRNLSASHTDNVVEVRRSSDDTLDSFTAAEVADGTLTDWVTEEQVGWNLQPTWDVNTGDGIISSQSSTATTSTVSFTTTSGVSAIRQSSKPSHIVAASGDTVEINLDVSGLDSNMRIRLSPSGSNVTSKTFFNISNGDNQTLSGTLDDDAGYLRFLDLEATSGATITINSIKVIGKSGFVSQWYDQSGNANHATQGTNASQPKIVDAGSLVSGGLEFDGVNDFLEQTLTLTQPVSIFSAYKAISDDSPITGSASSSLVISRRSSGEYIMFSGAVLATGVHPSTEVLASCTFDGASSTGHWNGVEVLSGDAGTRTDFEYVGRNSAAYLDGTIQEIIIYNSDQSDNRTAFEANIGETYGIDLPSGVDTGYDQVDGFVETWYDQSGNGNDATQSVAGSQPKIVDAGVYLGEVDFLDGTSTFLATTNSDLCNVAELSVFSVLKPHIAQSQVVAFSCGSVVNGSTGYGGWRLNLNGYIDQAQFQTQAIGSGSTTTLINSVGGNDTLVSYVADFPDAAIFANGQAGLSSSSTISPNNSDIFRRRFRIGCQYTYQVAGFYTQPIKELILYTSDQSANRAAIETNINNQYDIY